MRSVSSPTGTAYSRDTEPVTHRQPTSRAGWWRFLLAALAAAVVTLLGAGTASATTPTVAQTRVGASTVAVARVVGPHECITAGQRWGNAPPAAEAVVATGVAANTARAAAEAEAAALRQAGGRLPTATSAAVDRTTGRVFTGTSGESVAVPDALRSRLPDPSLEPWSAANCAEVAACSRAISAGANLDDLVTYTVRTRTGEYFPPCRNCQVWLPGGGQ